MLTTCWVGKVGQRWVGFSLGSLGSVWFVVCHCWVYIVVVCLADVQSSMSFPSCRVWWYLCGEDGGVVI